jgi:hypothetical protein
LLNATGLSFTTTAELAIVGDIKVRAVTHGMRP